MRLLILLLILATATCSANWELRRDDFNKDRPPIVDGVVSLEIGDPGVLFPRYLNELGIKSIQIRFKDTSGARRKLSVVWSGGSQGQDKFAVSVGGVAAGESNTIDSDRLPYMWHRDSFLVKMGTGEEHVIEIRSIPEFPSAIELAGIQLASPESADYQPLCYESAGSLERYEKLLGDEGTVIQSAHLWVYAPQKNAVEAKVLAAFLENAYAAMKAEYGTDLMFKFSVEHYPSGTERGWGGISGTGTIGYTTESLERFKELGTTNVRGFAGYVEEMCHAFASQNGCSGTYEALGVAVSEEVSRHLATREVADAFWLPEHKQWNETQKAYLAAGRKNPDPSKYPNRVLYTRILNALFLKLRNEYGERMWPDFFAELRQQDFPLHRAKETERMKVYADIFSAVFKRDMRKEFTDFGIDLDADPPWGWQTRS
jgi:hypothetical protein